MPALINWDLLAHPYNWIIVILMLAIGAYALCLLSSSVGHIGELSNLA
jgi:hypothetical protein